MTINNENQQQDNNKTENSTEKNWILHLAPHLRDEKVLETSKESGLQWF